MSKVQGASRTSQFNRLFFALTAWSATDCPFALLLPLASTWPLLRVLSSFKTSGSVFRLFGAVMFPAVSLR